MSCDDEKRGKCKEGLCDNRKRTAAGWGAAGAVAGLLLGGPIGAVIAGAAGAAIGDEAARSECKNRKNKSD